MKYAFTEINIEKAILEFSENSNFIYTALPRLKMLFAIKKDFLNLSNLVWFFEFDHVNVNNNNVSIHLQHSSSEEFSFYYEIPLSQGFEFRVYLAKSTIHFLDLYNFLIEKGTLKKDQFILKAAYRTIPYFVLNTETKKYNRGILNQYSGFDNLTKDIIDENIKNEIQKGIKMFTPIFEQLLNQFKI